MADNKDVMTHPLDIPDATTRWRMEDNAQELGGEESWNPEERINVDTPYSTDRNEPSGKAAHPNVRRGGGVGARDVLLESTKTNDENIDPELIFIGPDKDGGLEDEKKEEGFVTLNRSDVPEYLSSTKWRNKSRAANVLKRNFKSDADLEKISGAQISLPSQSDEDASSTRDRILNLKKHWKPKKGVSIEAELPNPVAEYWEELKEIWKDPNAGIAYKYNSDPRKDSIVFVSSGKMLGIPVASINETFKEARVNREIQRPMGDGDKAVLNNFRSLKIGDGVFKGDKFVVEDAKHIQKGSEKSKVDPSGFNLVRYDRGLEKYTNGVTGISAKESAENKKAFEDFWTTWVKSPNEIEKVLFNVNPKTGKRIDSVTLVTKSGEEFTVPSWILRAALTLGRSDIKGNEGFKFTGGQGSVAYIDSATPSEMAKNILLKTNVNGVKLPESVEVIVGKPQ